MLEVEVKYPVEDFTPLVGTLIEWGAQRVAPLHEADHYFNAPDRDFARTDEALRLRRIGASNRVTYKGPKREALTKTRTEVEVPLADGERAAEDFIQLLTHLGFRAVAVVTKIRQTYLLQQDGCSMEICLDEVDGVGRFVELEILAPEEQLAKARAVVLRVASALKLTGQERRSYLEMLLEKKGERKR